MRGPSPVLRSSMPVHPVQKLVLPDKHAPLLHPCHMPKQPAKPVVGMLNAFAGGRNGLSARQIAAATRPPEFPDARVYFVPGFLDYMPSNGFLQRLHQSAGHGLAVIMASPDEHYHDRNGFTLVGGRDGFYTADWHAEIPTLIQRLYVDLREAEFTGHSPKQLVFIGHSKGGLLLHALGVIANHVKTHRLEKLYGIFPQLRSVPRQVIEYVGNRLNGHNSTDEAKYLAIGTPFDGIGEPIQRLAKITQFDRMFGGTSKYYDPHFLKHHYTITGIQPEDVIHGVITTQPYDPGHKPSMSGLLIGSAARILHPFRPTIYNGGVTLFDAAAAIIDPGSETDGLVRSSERPFPHQEHYTGHNHLTQVGDDMAKRVIDLIRQIIG